VTNDSTKAPMLRVMLMPDNSAQVSIENMNLLQIMGVSMLLTNKVHESLIQMGNLDMAELVASVLETQAALYLLAEGNRKGN